MIAALALVALAVRDRAGRDQPEGNRCGSSSTGKIKPHALPRSHEAPVTVVGLDPHLDDRKKDPPELLRISLALNRHGHIDYKGLPKCHVGDIQPATNVEALQSLPLLDRRDGLLLGQRDPARTVAVPV